jgi:hypothetical protein
MNVVFAYRYTKKEKVGKYVSLRKTLVNATPHGHHSDSSHFLTFLTFRRQLERL